MFISVVENEEDGIYLGLKYWIKLVVLYYIM